MWEGAGRVAQVLECLPTKPEALNSNQTPVLQKKKKKKRKEISGSKPDSAKECKRRLILHWLNSLPPPLGSVCYLKSQLLWTNLEKYCKNHYTILYVPLTYFIGRPIAEHLYSLSKSFILKVKEQISFATVDRDNYTQSLLWKLIIKRK
jgi:hypothetical protein